LRQRQIVLSELNELTTFNMKQIGTASRWNTLRALRVLNQFDPENE